MYGRAKGLRAEGYRTLPLPSRGTPVDARFQRGILSFKHAAEYAGPGRIGRTSLLISERFGPRVRLACLLTDAPLPSTRREVADACADCAGPCVVRCPAGARSLSWVGIPGISVEIRAGKTAWTVERLDARRVAPGFHPQASTPWSPRRALPLGCRLAARTCLAASIADLVRGIVTSFERVGGPRGETKRRITSA